MPRKCLNIIAVVGGFKNAGWLRGYAASDGIAWDGMAWNGMQLRDATTKASKRTKTMTCKSGTKASYTSAAAALALSGMWKRLQGH